MGEGQRRAAPPREAADGVVVEVGEVRRGLLDAVAGQLAVGVGGAQRPEPVNSGSAGRRRLLPGEVRDSWSQAHVDFIVVVLAHRTTKSTDGVEKFDGRHLQRVCKTDESWVFQTAS
ncbi:hypothetical protein OPV22_015049 [Ensete ventricosum]|uniref:Uncharacterized protein n=1 Tax=Ensete ventricosum TaxID=4639 RepID=A0AAV8PLB4_ENSVE|nr:hypothetical protein OPV22_015049 [Ensete ventricosum]